METRSLWVQLTDEQVEARSRQLARAHLDVLDAIRELETFRASMKSTADARRKIIDAKRGEVDALAEAVDNRRERTSVECDWRYNFAGEGAKYLIRRDTGEAVEKAAIGQKERQVLLDGPDEAPVKATVAEVRRWEADLAAIQAAREAEGLEFAKARGGVESIIDGVMDAAERGALDSIRPREGSGIEEVAISTPARPGKPARSVTLKPRGSAKEAE